MTGLVAPEDGATDGRGDVEEEQEACGGGQEAEEEEEEEKGEEEGDHDRNNDLCEECGNPVQGSGFRVQGLGFRGVRKPETNSQISHVVTLHRKHTRALTFQNSIGRACVLRRVPQCLPHSVPVIKPS